MSLYSARVAQDSPVLYFENNSSGVNNTGSRNVTITTGTANQFFNTGGISNSPYMYVAGAGSTYGFELSDTASTFNDKVFSITGWVKSDGYDNQDNINYIFHTGTLPNGIAIDSNPSGLTIYASPNGFVNSVSSASGGLYSNDTWHHVAWTMDATDQKLYMDGSLVATSATPASISMDGLVQYWMRETTSGTPRRAAKGRFDEWAVFNTTLSSTTIAEHYAAGFAVEYAADVSTASALAVQPAVATTRNISIAADPATASATADGHYQTDIDLPILLETYMQSLATSGYLEQWWKFDQYKVITNYGTGGQSGIGFLGNSYSQNQNGIQGSGCIRFTGSLNDGAIAGSNPSGLAAYNTELSDGNYVMGMWFKAPAGMTDTRTIFAVSDANGKFINLNFLGGTGKFNYIVYSNHSHTIESTSTINPQNWNFIAAKFSGTTMELFVNGVSQGTQTVGGTLPGTITSGGFGNNNVSAIGGTPLYVSQFFIGNTTNITNTVLTNIYNAGNGDIQASAEMAMPTFKDDNAFNSYVLGLSPYFYYKLDETSGAPQSVAEPMALLADGSSYTQNITTKNKKGLRITNRDTVIGNLWTAPAGTFSTNNRQSFAVYAKPVSGSNANLIASTGAANYNGSGIGLTLVVNASGQTLLRIFTSFSTSELITNTNTNVTDGNYHLFVGVKDGSTLKLYIDGKLTNTLSSSSTLTDNGQFLLGGHGAIAPSNLARDVTVDEIAMFASALTDSQVFEMWRSLTETMDTTATAAFPMPAYQAGTGVTTTADVSTASAFLPNVFPFVSPATATGLFQMPNFLAQKVVSVTADVMTASAQGENPGFDIGENNLVLHMDASAMMGDARPLIPGFWNANPSIAQAAMVQPALSTTLGALIKPQSFNANAFAPLPPAYFTIADDLWYQRLVAIDQKDTVGNSSIVFFNTSDNFYVGSDPAPGSGWTVPYSIGITGINNVTTPLPAINGGYFDAQNRKAVNLRNIALTTGAPSPFGAGDKDFTFEIMIKTTKSNQVLFVGENESIYNFQRTGIILRDGKLALTFSKDRRAGSVSANDEALAFIGNKNIADGQWHHLIIQNRQTGTDSGGARIQFWIDGQLDIQRYGNEMFVINRVGYNSSEENSYSDFTISAFGLGLSAMVEENEINLNYLAAINVVPVKAGVATARTTFGAGTRGKGNRARALMLYFWPTFKAGSGYYVGNYNNPFSPVGANDTEGKDVGREAFDYDTFYGLSTYLTQSTQTFFDWDVFPLPVQKFYAGDTYRGDRNPLLNETVRIGNGPEGDTYKDNITDNYRYLNLMKDVYELDQYDAIFFRNYPDQSEEQDQQGLNSKTEVDSYFNLQEKTLFKEFLDSLREAIDTYGISLFVTNPQLAVDLGIIEAATPVPLFRNSGNFNEGEWSDNRAPVITGRISPNTFEPIDPIGGSAGWYDTFFNDKHRVINTLEYLTDDNAFIWTDYAYYQNSDEFNYGGPNREFKSYVNRPNGLQIGDEFVFADSGNPKFRLPYQAIKPEHLKAGIPITALGATSHVQNFDSYQEGPNPYKDYITTVALPAGTNLNGKLTGGKIFVSFSENVANSFTAEGQQFGTSYEEYHPYDLATNYWVDIAFNAGIIDANTRALYKNSALTDAERGQPPLAADGDLIAQRWSYNGSFVVSQLIPITRNLKGFVGGEVGPEIPAQNRKRTRAGLGGVAPSTRLRDALGRFASGTSGGGATATTGGLVTYKVTTGRIYDTGYVFIPSINTRGLWWLSDKNVIEGKVVGGVGMSASATIPNPIVTADHPGGATASHMLAQATLVDNTSGTKNNLAVPLTASASMPTLGGRRIFAEPAAAFGFMTSVYSLTETDYTVTLYLNHTDPILYIRKEVIK